jgi:hypothetical protein
MHERESEREEREEREGDSLTDGCSRSRKYV